MTRYVAAGVLTGATLHALITTGLYTPFVVAVAVTFSAAMGFGIILRGRAR